MFTIGRDRKLACDSESFLKKKRSTLPGRNAIFKQNSVVALKNEKHTL